MGTEELTLSKNNQHSDYRMIYPYALKQGAWVPGAFTPDFLQVFATRPERSFGPSAVLKQHAKLLFAPHKKNLTHHFK